MARPRKETLLRLYRGPDPYRWASLADIAQRYRTSIKSVKEWFSFYSISIRTPKESFAKIMACSRQGSNPRHYSDLELRARKFLENHGLERGRHWRHNRQVGTARCDFYFHRNRLDLEIDSIWHDADPKRSWNRSKGDRARDERLLENKGVRTVRVRWWNEMGAEVGLFVALRGSGVL